MIPPVEVTTTVATSPAEAFRIFTEEVDAWWLQGPRYRRDPQRLSVLELEATTGGRLLETYASGEPASVVLAVVRSIEAPMELSGGTEGRLTLELSGRDFAPGEYTVVDISFTACAEGTRVDVVHGGWDLLNEAHPGFFGLEGVALYSLYGLWWGDLLSSLARRGSAQASD